MAVIIRNLGISKDPKKLFVDLKLDLETQVSSISTNRNTSQNDVALLINGQAIRTRLINLLSTLPGQMVLDPTYGCNLNQYMFEPISRDRGYVIGRYIRSQIEKFVPQIKLEKITVVSDTDNQMYDIEIAYSIFATSEKDKTTIVIDRNAGQIRQI